MQPNTNKSLSIIGLIVTVVFIIIVIIISFTNSKTTNALEKKIWASVAQLNKTAPVMIDSITRFDSAAYVSENTLLYNFTLINTSKEELDTAFFQKTIHPIMLQEIKADVRFKYFTDRNVTFVYRYRYEDGELIQDVTATPEQYNK